MSKLMELLYVISFNHVVGFLLELRKFGCSLLSGTSKDNNFGCETNFSMR